MQMLVCMQLLGYLNDVVTMDICVSTCIRICVSLSTYPHAISLYTTYAIGLLALKNMYM